MKAFTLWDPWATLFVAGEKGPETRPDPTHVRGWVGVHRPGTAGAELMRLADYRAVSRALRRQERLHRQTRRMMVVAIVLFLLTILVNARAFAAGVTAENPRASGRWEAPTPPASTRVGPAPGAKPAVPITVAADVTSTTSSTRPRRRRPQRPPAPTPVMPPETSAPSSRTVESTAYCLTGEMANGELVHDGAVAMNGVRFGARWRVLSGPFSGRVLTVKDRIGHSSDFDVAMPGRCDEALGYGRRSIEIERVG